MLTLALKIEPIHLLFSVFYELFVKKNSLCFTRRAKMQFLTQRWQAATNKSPDCKDFNHYDTKTEDVMGSLFVKL